MRRWIFLLWGLSIVFVQVSQAAPILSANTETAVPGESVPSETVVQPIIDSADQDELEGLAECMADLKIPKGACRQLFRAVALPGTNSSEEVYFVRPALEPYCHTFYGAHVFRFWLIAGARDATPKTYKVRYAGVGDNFEVLPSTTNGSYDIEVTNCTAWRCLTVSMKFDGKKYVPSRCVETTSRGDQGEAVREVDCGR